MKRFESLFYILVVLGLIIRYTSDGGDDFDRKGQDQPDFRAEHQPPGSNDPLQKEASSLERDWTREVLVEVEDEYRNGSGTAFSVAPGRWVTARHVVNRCATVYLQFPGKQHLKVKGVELNRSADMAIIRTGRFSRPAFSYTENLPGRGDMGYLMGYPQGNAGDIAGQMIGATRMRTTGAYSAREKVIAWAERDRRPSFTGSAGGISGGPAFDANGDIIGIAVAGAPRRGRMYTAHPDTLRSKRLARSGDGSGKPVKGGIDSGNFHRVGDALRLSGRIAKVLCIV